MDRTGKQCAWCKGVVPVHFRMTLGQKKASRSAKVFYHYACAGWKKMELKRK